MTHRWRGGRGYKLLLLLLLDLLLLNLLLLQLHLLLLLLQQQRVVLLLNLRVHSGLGNAHHRHHLRQAADGQACRRVHTRQRLYKRAPRVVSTHRMASHGKNVRASHHVRARSVSLRRVAETVSLGLRLACPRRHLISASLPSGGGGVGGGAQQQESRGGLLGYGRRRRREGRAGTAVRAEPG